MVGVGLPQVQLQAVRALGEIADPLQTQDRVAVQPGPRHVRQVDAHGLGRQPSHFSGADLTLPRADDREVLGNGHEGGGTPRSCRRR